MAFFFFGPSLGLRGGLLDESADVSSGVSVRFRLAAVDAEIKDMEDFFLSVVDCGEVEGPAWGIWGRREGEQGWGREEPTDIPSLKVWGQPRIWWP